MIQRRSVFLFIVTALILSACQPVGPPPNQTAANQALVRSNFLDVWNRGDLAVVDATFAPDYIGHLPGNEIQGSEAHKGLVAMFRSAFPDWTFTIEGQWASGDTVITRWSMRGTHQGELMGIPPTHQLVELTGTDIHRIADGLVAESWVEFNELSLMRQLGFDLVPVQMPESESSAPLVVNAWVAFDREAGEFPEGVTVDSQGAVYASFMDLGQVVKIMPDGESAVFAEFPGASLVGMAVDSADNVYVTVGSEDANLNGVARVAPDGTVQHIPGTEAISMGNAIAVGEADVLYITDNIEGTIWRAAVGEAAELWFDHPLLRGTGDFGFGIPIGANGIGYYEGAIFVVNSEMQQMVQIPVLADGSAGSPTLVVESGVICPPDGLAIGESGAVYVACITESQLIRIDPKTGTVTTLATAEEGLDWPASVAFGQGENAATLYISNFAIGPEGGPGPGIVMVDVGEGGYFPAASAE